MSLFHILAVLLTASAIFSYINYRFLKLPTTIGIMLAALCFSLLLNLLGPIGIDIEHEVRSMLGSIDFDATLLHGMLSFLLFAGALHVDLSDLAKQRGVIIVLATAGVVATTCIIGGLSFYAFELVGLGIPFVYCLLFGALISPTDPIAVLGILKQAHAPKSLEAKISGESLFNDGMAVVVFLVLIRLAIGEAGLSASDVILLFSQEAIGGVLFGLGAGAVSIRAGVDGGHGDGPHRSSSSGCPHLRPPVGRFRAVPVPAAVLLVLGGDVVRGGDAAARAATGVDAGVGRRGSDHGRFRPP